MDTPRMRLGLEDILRWADDEEERQQLLEVTVEELRALGYTVEKPTGRLRINPDPRSVE